MFYAMKLKLALNPMSKQSRAVISLFVGPVKPEQRKNRTTLSKSEDQLP